ncbi:unnamed protein product [Coffea canephora]|uniref:Uncharacterized protein n=1 Tax=Coffea canephora TaxID=49390 RepID=A0A068UHE2_COFCA|nr:unnamed protein product [Coffea canephora]
MEQHDIKEDEFGFSRNYFLAKELGNSNKKSGHKLADIDVIDEQELREALANIEQKHEKEIDDFWVLLVGFSECGECSSRGGVKFFRLCILESCDVKIIFLCLFGFQHAPNVFICFFVWQLARFLSRYSIGESGLVSWNFCWKTTGCND